MRGSNGGPKPAPVGAHGHAPLGRGRTGPKTEKGRAIASRNALKHGITSSDPVIAGMERQSDWRRHLDGIVASLAPEGELERALAERVALLLWRLRRVARYELAVINSQGEGAALSIDRRAGNPTAPAVEVGHDVARAGRGLQPGQDQLRGWRRGESLEGRHGEAGLGTREECATRHGAIVADGHRRTWARQRRSAWCA